MQKKRKFFQSAIHVNLCENKFNEDDSAVNHKIYF